MKQIMTDQQAFDLLNAPAMQVGHMDTELSQFEETVVKVKCSTKETAKELMYLARRIGADAYARYSVLTLILPSWKLGLLDKFEILANR